MTRTRLPEDEVRRRKNAGKKRWAQENSARVTEYQRASNRAKRLASRDFIREQKRRPCMDCGGTFDPVCMDFDHRPGETKEYCITAMQRSNPNRLAAEIAKCDVVCANCHRLRTAQRMRNGIVGTGVQKQPTPQLSLLEK